MWCTINGVEYNIKSNKDCDNSLCSFRRTCVWYIPKNEPKTYSDNQTKSIKEMYKRKSKYSKELKNKIKKQKKQNKETKTFKTN